MPHKKCSKGVFKGKENDTVKKLRSTLEKKEENEPETLYIVKK